MPDRLAEIKSRLEKAPVGPQGFEIQDHDDMAWLIERVKKLEEVRRCAAGVQRTADTSRIPVAVVGDWWDALREALEAVGRD